MPKFLNEIQLIETGSIGAPPPGFISLFVSSSGLLFIETSDGIVTKLF